MKITMIIVKVLFLGALFIVSNQNLYLSESVDRNEFYELYFSWITGLVSQSLDLTEYFMKSEWLPGADLQPIERVGE